MCRRLRVAGKPRSYNGGPAAVVEWFKSTALRPYLAPLNAAEQAAFLARYLEAVTGAYPALPDGTAMTMAASRPILSLLSVPFQTAGVSTGWPASNSLTASKAV